MVEHYPALCLFSVLYIEVWLQTFLNICTNSVLIWDKAVYKSHMLRSYRVVKCQSVILEKIVYMVFSSKSLMVIMLKCRRYRGVTGFRPPPKKEAGQKKLKKIQSLTEITLLIGMHEVTSFWTEKEGGSQGVINLFTASSIVQFWENSTGLNLRHKLTLAHLHW